MAADMHLHIITDEFTEEHYKAFQSNSLGSDYFNPDYNDLFEKEHNCDLYMLCSQTPNIWIGEVSWLKAALFGDNETYIPSLVEKVSDIVGEHFPIIDDNFIAQIREAFVFPNKTAKEGGVFSGRGYALSKADEVCQFLETYKGRKCFTISW